MPDSVIKISDLDILTKAELDKVNDYLVINDYSANKTKTIKVQDVMENTGLPTSGSHLDFLVYSNRKVAITTATIVSSFVLDITLAAPHGISTGDTIKIYFDDRIQGFPALLYGNFVVTVMSANILRIASAYNLTGGSFSSAGNIELVGYKDYNYFYDGVKTVEVIYNNGRIKPLDSIQAAVYEAALEGGTVLVHKRASPYIERIYLKDGVDIILEEGVVITNNSTNEVFIDNGVSVNCKILGQGTIKQTGTGTAIYLTGTNSDIYIECNYIEVTGYGNGGGTSACISSNIKNLVVKCHKMVSKDGCGILMGSNSQTFNFTIDLIETGINGTPNTGSTAIWGFGDGYYKIDKIVCWNNGHCFSHHKGKCVAHITRMYKYNNLNYIAPVSMLGHQTFNSVDVTIYFDEISSYNGLTGAPPAVECGRGILNLYGRRIHTDGDSAITYQLGPTGYEPTIGTPYGRIQVDEIYSGNWHAVDINSGSSNPVVIENSKIYANGTGGSQLGAFNIGNFGNTGINSYVILRDCHIQQLTNNTSCHAIRVGTGTQTLILSGCELETVNASAYSIFSGGIDNLTAGPDRNVIIRKPIWQNKSEQSTIHYITTGGTLIQ